MSSDVRSINCPRLALNPSTLSQPSMWSTSSSSPKWAVTLDTNCLFDTVPEAARYMEYSSNIVHVSVAFSAIVETTDLSVSSTGAMMEGRVAETTRKRFQNLFKVYSFNLTSRITSHGTCLERCWRK